MSSEMRTYRGEVQAMRDEAQALLDSANTRLDALADAGIARAYEWWVGRRDAYAEVVEKLSALLARAEAGADGVIDITSRDYQAGFDAGVDFYDDGSGRNRDWRKTHPQDASGDAERFAAVMNCQWLRSSKYGDQVLGWREEFLSRVNAEVVAMQAKEAK